MRTWILGLGLSLVSTWAVAGGWSSGGGGHTTDENNPWFLGDAPIEYCVKVAEGFPFSQAQVSAMIRDVFDQWKDFYVRYGIYKKPLPGSFKDGVSRSVTVDAVEVPECLIGAHQLEFKIGKMDEMMERYFATQSRTTVGISHRKEYDHEFFRTGGFVWVAPEGWVKELDFPHWNDIRLKSILIHEVGHVLGLPHVRGSIMDGEIFEELYFHEKIGGLREYSFVKGKVETEASRFNPFLLSTWMKSEKSFFCKLGWKGLAMSGPEAPCEEQYTFSKRGFLYMHVHLRSPESGKTLTLTFSVHGPSQQFEQQIAFGGSPNYVLKHEPSNGFVSHEILLPLVEGGVSVFKGSADLLGKRYFVELKFGTSTEIEVLGPGYTSWHHNSITGRK